MKLITGITNGMPEDFELLKEQWMKYEGKKVEIETKRKVDRRTNPQNRYLWGVVIDLIHAYMEDKGYDLTREDWYDFYKSKGYFGYKEVMGEQVPKGSSESTTLEFQQAVEKMQREWAFRGLDIPSPNEEDYKQP